ncbi:hypothetical protein [Melittangium boletus]|uniref:hypothetical protein n=1 Tax=Melittangium boletus TaxID=83453 RepID=UPI003DA1D4DA
MSVSQRRFLLSLPVLVAIAACVSETTYPGDVVVGLFSFHAQADWARTDCDADGGDFSRLTDGGFDFAGTFSRDSVDGGAWLTVDGYARPATYSVPAQRYVSSEKAPAQVPSCGDNCTGAQIEETLSVVVLSDSQDRSMGSRCVNLPAGGLPDGSVPAPTANGYDAQRACGTLSVTFLPGTSPGCKCKTACTAVYGLEGERRFNGGQ